MERTFGVSPRVRALRAARAANAGVAANPGEPMSRKFEGALRGAAGPLNAVAVIDAAD